jgi:hypothetical protein
MANPGWAQAFATLFLGLVGLWFANNYRRQIKIQLVERQLDAYVRLWRITETSNWDRTTPLDAAERQQLYDRLVKWYFEDGDGVFLPARTRDLYIGLRTNLVCPINEMQPSTLARQLALLSPEEAELRRGCVSVHQFSLLRTQLKGDMAIHRGYWYYRTLRPGDREFLRSCGLSSWRGPWRPRLRLSSHGQTSNPCLCGLCDDNNRSATIRKRMTISSATPALPGRE